MKFTKTFVAVAIAGIAATPMIASADTTLSGVVEVKLHGDDTDTVDDSGDLQIGVSDVLIGVVSEHELNNGLTGYGSLRWDLDQLSNEGAAISADNVYTGIKGGFGDVRIGEIPLAVEYGQVANDIYDVGDEINGGISYTGDFGPVGVIANFSPEHSDNSDAVGVGIKFGLGGFSIGLGAEDRAEAQNAAAGLSFSMAGASIAAHAQTKEAADTDGSDLEGFAVKVGYGFGGVSAAVTFATEEGDTTDNETIRLDLGYGMGGGFDLSTRINSISSAGADDVVDYRIQLAKSF